MQNGSVLQRFILTIGRTALLSHPAAVPTKRPNDWSVESAEVDESSTGKLKQIAMDCKHPAVYTTQARNQLLQRYRVDSSAAISG